MREKLIELLKQAPFEGKVLDEWWWEEKIARIADHLIANGVTVQKQGVAVEKVIMQLCNSDGEVVTEYYGLSCPFCDTEIEGDYCCNCGAKIDAPKDGDSE